MASKHVCRFCGVPVGIWGRGDGSTYWKHQNGGSSGAKACKRTPQPITREAYRAEMVAAVQMVKDRHG